MSLCCSVYGLWLAVLLTSLHAAPQPEDYFVIQVVDEATGRGVPLVELKTVNEVAYWTDSAGVVAFYEPGLMNQTVFFHVRSHGYEFPKDGFGYRGKALKTTPGGRAQLKIKRLNIAERLYRVTGEGIYRDSVLAGLPTPLRQPVLNGQVAGQDSVMAAQYRGKIYWFWGDTSRPSYPLGHFGTAGATSERPGHGGLDPGAGVNLDYFTDTNGFSRPLCAWPGPGMKWIGGLLTVSDDAGQERLIARCDTMKSLGEILERALIVFKDETASFDRLVPWDLKAPLFPESHPFRVTVRGEDYCYFPSWAPQPCIRVKADWRSLTNAAAYESFTCLAPGSRYDKAAPRLDRAPDGRLIYGWKRDTDFLGHQQQRELAAAGHLQREEGWLQMTDLATGAPAQGHGGSVCWNDYRQRWVMIALGKPGEIWFAEADTPVGPWVYAQRVVAHQDYNFYNPTQHPFFDQDEGRLIYFEGTYTGEFSAARTRTPRYDYNQIMYRLDLADPRLALPAPVYRLKARDDGARYLMREGVEAEEAWNQVEAVPFFAMPPSRKSGELVGIHAVARTHGTVLYRYPPVELVGKVKPLFYAWPAEYIVPTNPLEGTWDFAAKTAEGADVTSTVEFRLNGEQVQAQFDTYSLLRTVEVQKGTFRNSRLELEVMNEGKRYAVAGTLRDGKLSGEWRNLAGEEHGPWTGRRINLLPADASTPALVRLYEYRRISDGAATYSVDPPSEPADWKRAEPSVCWVWRNPMNVLILDGQAKPAGTREVGRKKR